MNKILITTAALSLMLLACGDDISTDINVQGSSPIPRGNVIANIGECGHNSASFGKAYMTNTDNGGFQVVVPDMHVNDEWQNDELLAERVGDTLHVWEERETFITLNWICYAHHTFDISAEDSNVREFSKGTIESPMVTTGYPSTSILGAGKAFIIVSQCRCRYRLSRYLCRKTPTFLLIFPISPALFLCADCRFYSGVCRNQVR